MEPDKTHKLQYAAKRGAMASVAGDLILKELLEKRCSETYTRLIYEFDSGKNCDRIVAELSAIEKIKTDLHLMIVRGEIASNKLNNEGDPSEHA